MKLIHPSNTAILVCISPMYSTRTSTSSPYKVVSFPALQTREQRQLAISAPRTSVCAEASCSMTAELHKAVSEINQVVYSPAMCLSIRLQWMRRVKVSSTVFSKIGKELSSL